VTSPRARGKDSVHLHGDRWRGPASLGRAPHAPDRKGVSGATKCKVLGKLRDLRSIDTTGETATPPGR
jgi:hypothetical protein